MKVLSTQGLVILIFFLSTFVQAQNQVQREDVKSTDVDDFGNTIVIINDTNTYSSHTWSHTILCRLSVNLPDKVGSGLFKYRSVDDAFSVYGPIDRQDTI